MVYLDLDELPALTGNRGLLPTGKYSSRSFHRGDHLFEGDVPLRKEIESIVQAQTGESPRGPIRLLTQLRFFGYYFSPLNLFYVYDQRGEQVEYVVAEVNNTPWRERHCYVLWKGNAVAEAVVDSPSAGSGGDRPDSEPVASASQMETPPADSAAAERDLRFAHGKEFHVSPFMEMEFDYAWRLREPGASASIKEKNIRESEEVFQASLQLRRRPLTTWQLRRMTLRYPLMTLQVAAAIYYQALRLWCKRCPLFVHPKKRRQTQPFRGTPSRTSNRGEAPAR